MTSETVSSPRYKTTSLLHCRWAVWLKWAAPATVMVALAACEPEPKADQTPWALMRDHTEYFFEPHEDIRLNRSQVLYVPVYSNLVAAEGGRPTEMAANLALRNTDRHSPIFVTSVVYYDTSGRTI
jgi:hypothetical protein